MQNDKKLFSKLNTDDEERFLQSTDYINLENCIIAQNEFSKNFAVQNVPSTELLFYYTSGLNTLGTVSDYQNKRLFWLDHNEDTGLDTLFAYDLNLKITYRVIVSTQIDGGLNLSNDFRIDRNFNIVDGLAVWTDDLNEPKSIDVEAGIKLNQPSYVTNVQPYGTPIPYETSTLIKRPPIYPLQMTKLFDGSFLNNYIKNNAYQGTVFYTYKNYQQSVLAPYSALAPYNSASEDSNYILFQLPFSETIPDYVQSVSFCVKYGNDGITFIVKTFDKNNPYDAMAIASHNSKSVQLSFSFFDNTIGIALDEITANTSFDSVALLAKTLEAAKNRIFLGNVLKGYNTPSTTSLTAAVVNVDTGGGGATYSGTWGYVTLHANLVGGCQDTYMYPFVYISSGAPQVFYYFPSVRNSTIWNGGVGTVPSNVNYFDATFGGASEASLITYLKATQYPYSPSCAVGSPTWQVPYQISAYNALGAVTVTAFEPANVIRFFKSSSDYEIDIEFKDRFNRKCGVVNKAITVTTPPRTFTQVSFTASIQWTLSNADAIDEIPDWAYYYQIVIKKNQTTRFFEQIRATGVQYVTKNQDGTFTYGNTWTFGTTYAIGIDLSALTNYGLGYTFNQGDFAHLILSDDTFLTLAVLGQDGNFVWLSPTDVGTGSTTTIVFLELYTPYKPTATEPYFEVPNVYNISNPGTINRAYSTLTDTISGDTYAIERTDSSTANYIVEAMSPNDNVWQIWQTDTGFPNFIDTIGQQQKSTAIDWSDTFITGAKVNGLNKFQPLNTKDVGASSGSIQKLQLTNKMEESGTVMLVITDTDTLSAYLGELQLYNAASVEGLITTVDVIGSINSLQNGQGTINPESVVEYNGTVWWINVLKGVVAQYSTNGVDNVSDTKMRRFFDRFSKRYVELGKAGVKALCGFSHIAGCVDITNGFYSLVLPQTEVNAVVSGIPVGFASALPSYDSLPDYASSIQNRFDIYDGQPKIMNYNFNSNIWVGAYQWLPECMEYFGNKLFGFKDGFLYLHNEDTSSYNNIYGVQYPQRICFTCNIPPSEVKSIFNIALEGKQIPNFTVLYTNYPNVQISDLTVDDYSNQEGVQYAQFFRDRLSPNTDGTVIDKLYKGDVIVGAVGYVMIEFQVYDEQLILNMSNIGFELSRGQGNIMIKPQTK